MTDYYNQGQYSAPPPAQGQYYATPPQHHYPGQDPPGYASSGYYPPDPQVSCPANVETGHEITQLTSTSNTALMLHLKATTKKHPASLATLLPTAAPPHHQTCK